MPPSAVQCLREHSRHAESTVKDSVQSLQSQRVSTRQPSLIKQHQENTETLSFSVPVWWTLPFSLSFCLPLLLSARAALVSSALCWGIPANCLHIPRLPLLKPGHCSLSYSLYCHEIDDDGNSETDIETDVCWNGMRSVYGISVYSLKHRFANTVQQLHKGGKRGDCK